MTATPMFHVGVLVPDMRLAQERFSKAMGLTFLDAVEAKVTRFRDQGREEPLRLRICWSRQGPPHLEILEVVGTGLYGPAHVGLHHIGLWEADWERRARELADAAVHITSEQFEPTGETIALYTDPTDLLGTRLEYVSADRQPQMEAWLSGAAWLD